VLHRPGPALTERERDLLRALAEGCPLAEMGARLGISQATARGRLRRLVAKLGGTGEHPRRPRTRQGFSGAVSAARGAASATGVLRRLDQAVTAAERLGEPLSVVVLELLRGDEDDGDEALAAVATPVVRAVAAASRQTDVVGPWERSTVLVLLPETALPGARAVAERLRRRVGDQVPCDAVALERARGEGPSELLARVRQALQEERIRREVGRTLWLQAMRSN
jgi:DNA-binding CsgD family transcriptional regulator/GGDEF domain-containing protein